MKTSKDIFKSLPLKVLLLLLISVISIPVLYQFNWSGFGEDSNKSKSIEKTIKDGKIISLKQTETEHFQSGKTLWDWLGLAGTLAIPIVLFQFQASEQRRAQKRASVEKEQSEELAKVEKTQAEQREKFEKDIAESNLREEAFQVYIDRMSEILINKRSRSELFLGENGNSSKDNSVRDVARIRTVTILRRLENDTERQNRILHFLGDTELLQFLLKTANFSGVNLNGANLSGINLCNVNFSSANLSGANLSSANLTSANLSNANLSKIILHDANLFKADLSNADLTNANLENSWIQDTKFINAELNNTRLVNARTWYEEEVYENFETIHIDGDEYSPDYYDERWYSTDFSGAKLTNANLTSTNFKAAKNLTPEQLKTGINWDKTIYKDELFNKLGLPKTLRSIIDSMSKDVDEDEDVNVEKFIGYQVEVRNYIDHETKTIIKGEITGFTRYNNYVNVKTSNGEQLYKLYLDEVYIYQNQ